MLASGVEIDVKPLANATKADVDRPVPVAVHVLPVHGDVAVIELLPPELEQPPPSEVAVAGQVVVRRAILIAAMPPATVKLPPATRSPFGNVVKAYKSPMMPDPNGDQDVPSQRAM